MKRFGYVITAFILICITMFCVTATVRGQEKMDKLELIEKERFYQAQEKELLRETKAMLEQMGFGGSGVTLNRVVEGEVERTYTFTIHHSRIDVMEPIERQELKKRLAVLTESFSCAASEDSCVFCYQFLIL